MQKSRITDAGFLISIPQWKAILAVRSHKCPNQVTTLNNFRLSSHRELASAESSAILKGEELSGFSLPWLALRFGIEVAPVLNQILFVLLLMMMMMRMQCC